MREAIDVDVVEVEDRLKSVARADLVLEMCEVAGEGGRRRLHLDQKPRLALSDHDEVDFSLLLVAQVAQLEASQAEVGPALYRLEEMASDEGLCTGARLVDDR